MLICTRTVYSADGEGMFYDSINSTITTVSSARTSKGNKLYLESKKFMMETIKAVGRTVRDGFATVKKGKKDDLTTALNMLKFSEY
ncbi:hypothetical protein OMAG_001554 [Candidatus Omnitrophus magneticus]|uniref:Uncharacterized protein n=1 Tax=Candidatus Omnitrophus magneticus TaxID=1609969 RepID=A0A0F0CRB0_9BACT|nr:hypothetical protein OMAG_001554 [Candidatus Omnitrophus magneticus]